MSEYITKKLDQMKGRLAEATNVIVRFAGKKKNGWAQSIYIEVRLKEKVIDVKQYLCRELGSFYASINKAFVLLSKKLIKYSDTTLDKRHRRERTAVRKSKLSFA